MQRKNNLTGVTTMTQEMDCSDAARMLIERMQTHPEDFGYGGKLYRVLSGEHLSERDKKAFNDAHDLYIKEPNLMASVLGALLAQPEEGEKNKVIAARGYQAGLGLGGMEGNFNAVTLTTQQRITREMYEDHIQAHKDALKAKPIPSKLSDIYNKALGRERIERDN
jgi:hypothetical protein